MKAKLLFFIMFASFKTDGKTMILNDETHEPRFINIEKAILFDAADSPVGCRCYPNRCLNT